MNPIERYRTEKLSDILPTDKHPANGQFKCQTRKEGVGDFVVPDEDQEDPEKGKEEGVGDLVVPDEDQEEDPEKGKDGDTKVEVKKKEKEEDEWEEAMQDEHENEATRLLHKDSIMITDSHPFIIEVAEGAPKAASWYAFELAYMLDKFFSPRFTRITPSDNDIKADEIHLFLTRACTLLCFVDWIQNYFVKLIKQIRGLEVCKLVASEDIVGAKTLCNKLNRAFVDTIKHLEWILEKLRESQEEGRTVDVPVCLRDKMLEELICYRVNKARHKLVSELVQQKYYLEQLRDNFNAMCILAQIEMLEVNIEYDAGDDRHFKEMHEEFRSKEVSRGMELWEAQDIEPEYPPPGARKYEAKVKAFPEKWWSWSERRDERAEELLGSARKIGNLGITVLFDATGTTVDRNGKTIRKWDHAHLDPDEIDDVLGWGFTDEALHEYQKTSSFVKLLKKRALDRDSGWRRRLDKVHITGSPSLRSTIEKSIVEKSKHNSYYATWKRRYGWSGVVNGDPYAALFVRGCDTSGADVQGAQAHDDKGPDRRPGARGDAGLKKDARPHAGDSPEMKISDLVDCINTRINLLDALSTTLVLLATCMAGDFTEEVRQHARQIRYPRSCPHRTPDLTPHRTPDPVPPILPPSHARSNAANGKMIPSTLVVRVSCGNGHGTSTQ